MERTCKIHTFDQNYYKEFDTCENEINDMLKKGWKPSIVQMCPKEGSDTAVLIIYEKEEKPKKQTNVD